MTAIVIVMGTNTLMISVELDARVFGELDRLFTADVNLMASMTVLDELEKLSSGGGIEGVATNTGADLATRYWAVETEEPCADSAVIELIGSSGVDYVITNNKPLHDRVLDCGIPVVGIRGRATLAITEP